MRSVTWDVRMVVGGRGEGEKQKVSVHSSVSEETLPVTSGASPLPAESVGRTAHSPAQCMGKTTAEMVKVSSL